MRVREVSIIWKSVCFMIKLLGKLEAYMPKVGKKKFSYTKKGKAAAKKLAQKIGKKLKSMKRKY